MHVKWIHSILQWSWIQENTTTSCTLRNNCSILRFFIPHQQNGYLHKNNTHPQLTQPQQGNTNTAPKDTTKYKITFTKIIFHAERFLGNLIPLCRSLYYCVHSLYMIFKILSSSQYLKTSCEVTGNGSMRVWYRGKWNKCIQICSFSSGRCRRMCVSMLDVFPLTYLTAVEQHQHTILVSSTTLSLWCC